MLQNLQNNTGIFVPTTNVWELEALQEDKDITPALKELLVRLYQNINNLCNALNLKDSGYYIQNEFLNGQVLFPTINASTSEGRQIFRAVVNFGALPNATTKSVAHGIGVTNGFSFTRIYATATNNVSMNFIPLPYASTTLINNIQLSVDRTNVTITTGIDYSSYTITYVVIEYVKQ